MVEEYFILKSSDNRKALFYSPLKNYCELIDDKNRESSIRSHYEKMKKSDYVDIDYSSKLPSSLYLTITNDCNLKCKYCYAGGGEEYKSGSTSKEILRFSIDSYYKKLIHGKNEEATIGFLGGCEPTCGFELLKYAIKYSNQIAMENRIKVKYTMATNGFYSDEISKYICENFDEISLSFDGLADIQNFQRPSRSGGKSFDRVLKNAQSLKKSNIKWNIHSVVTEHNIDHLESTINFFENQFANTKVVFALMDNSNANAKINAPNADKYQSEIIRLSKKYPNLQLSALVNYKYMKKNYCNSVSNLSWYVSETGDINTCMRSSHIDNSIFSIGHFDFDSSKIIFDKSKIENLKKFSVDNQGECRNCFAKYLCGGGCPYLRESGDWNCDIVKQGARDEIYRSYEERQVRRHLQSLNL